MKLQFTNTLSKKKETFDPLVKQRVSLYVCGITPYDRTHLGHGRVYVNFDVLVRLLRFLKYDVSYIRNYTDIDDKIIKKALNELGDEQKYAVISEKYITYFKEDLKKLNCLTPTEEPKVTECIDPIIEFTQQLVNKGNAYVLDHDVYFDISTFPSYGKLSGKKIDELEAGSRVNIDTRKKNPGDFALWKGNNDQLFWQSPWGYGRPGWHIECSVMAKKYLGEVIDIHGGGSDLMFPHHENEIAQSESLHEKPFSTYWLHNAFVNINKEKMSKSLGNMINLIDIFEQYDPMVLRYYYLQHHYRTPIDFSLDDLRGVTTAYKKLINLFELTATALDNTYQHPLTKEFFESLCDDLNTSKFLGLIFQHNDTIQKDQLLAQEIKSIVQNVLGLTLTPLHKTKVIITKEIQQLIDERETARKTKDWHRADILRDQLMALGIDLHDKKAP